MIGNHAAEIVANFRIQVETPVWGGVFRQDETTIRFSILSQLVFRSCFEDVADMDGGHLQVFPEDGR
jgi:hypothetical protein